MDNGQAICLSLQNKPSEWTATKFTLKHVPSGLQLWIANGSMFLEAHNSRHNVQLTRW